ncbi:MAG: hypothetical protein M0039_02030 [Pseudomonadota bacterium]|nr:hypothetical protein [Pseudomonadota bacterium]
MPAIHQNARTYAIAGVLALLMAATRFHHLEAAFNIPDASVAVFFLAGLFLPASWFFPVYLAEAALIDYLAITYGGVSAWCVSPAYAFLIPAYGVVWYAGRSLASRSVSGWRGWFIRLGAAVIAAVAAFVISTGSFYLFSGRVSSGTLVGYLLHSESYFQYYVGSAFAYVAIGLGVEAVVTAVRLRIAADVSLRGGTPR